MPWTPGPGVAAWATEAPRGLLFHRYELDEAGRVATARIVPPTSQNQAAIEADLTRRSRRRSCDLPHDEATHRLEQLIRSYDPCISCATHFLDLRVERPVVNRATAPVRLLVCGNADRGDDGAPLAAVATLLPSLPPHLLADLDVRRCEQLELEDLIDAAGRLRPASSSTRRRASARVRS